MSAVHKLLSRLQDPQSWVSMIAVATVLGLCTGAFEPGEAGGRGAPPGLTAQPAADSGGGAVLVAAADSAQP